MDDTLDQRRETEVNELNDDWLCWPPDALEGFFHEDDAKTALSGARPDHDNDTREDNNNETKWHAFFS